ncbi:MAG: hypothetical protein KGK07_13415 [Chloroflexota bacterium]|nr:hypothetical protein [Chloroflexota bacterium]
MARAGTARSAANQAAYVAGWRGARGGAAGAARARQAEYRAHPRTARLNERLYAEGVTGAGGGAKGAWAAWRRITQDRGPAHTYQRGGEQGQYRAMLEQALRSHGRADLFGARRQYARWDSEFNRLYRAALRDSFRHTRFGPYHDLLVYLGWRPGGKETPRWAAGNTPKAKPRS